MPFAKYHLPCPSCGGSDPVAVNEDNSAWCFSCDTRFPDYYKAIEGADVAPKTSDIQTYRNNSMNDIEGSFAALDDRGISVDTAKKYGVKSVKNQSSNVIMRHYYPYYVANEITGYKVREPNKMFSWRGNP